MRAALLSLAFACAAGGAEPGVQLESHCRRGWLTGGGLALAGGAVVALSLAGYEASKADAASRTLAAYYSHGAAPTAAEAPRIRLLQERADTASTQALGLLAGGGAALLLGVGLVLLDGWLGPAAVTVAIQPSGASVVLRGRF